MCDCEEPGIRYDLLFVAFIVICMFVLGSLASKAGLPVIQPNEPENNSPVNMPPAPEVLI
jgi:hypothetical protein